MLSILPRNENPEPGNQGSGLPDPKDCNPNTIVFKHDLLYRHNLIRINYTTYNVRRSQDVINTSSTHNNIMVLADDDDCDADPGHPFKYAQVLGVYHVNAVYIGPGAPDYQPRRVDFLWVRWYQHMDMQKSWDVQKLDRVRFLPVTDDGAFGFLDPSIVLRGCHIVPAFAMGRHYSGLSLEWKSYYVMR